MRLPSCRCAVLWLLPLAACDHTTEVFYGDTPGVTRVVAGVLDARVTRTPPEGPAVETRLAVPGAVALAPDGTFYFTDRRLRMLGRVASDGVLTWLAGAGPGCSTPGPGSGSDPLEACFGDPAGLARTEDGVLYLSDYGGNRVYRYDPATSALDVLFGNGELGRATNGLLARAAPADGPYGLFADPSGDLYVAERNAHRVIRISADGHLYVVAGSGREGDAGDGGSATQALLRHPEGVARIGATLYLSDAGNHRIRRIDDGVIRPFAGLGVPGFRGDGGGVGGVLFRRPSTLAAAGTLLFVVDRGNHRVRVIRTGADSISTFAGTGGAGPDIDGQEAARTAIGGPQGFTVLDRTVLIADSGSAVIRRVIR